jgi:carboxylesterase
VQLPGHGTTIEAMELCKWTDWLKGTRDAFQRLARTCDSMFVVGLSMGGLLTLILAEEMPIQAAVTISSPIRLQNWKAYFSFLIKYFKRYQSWPKDHDSKSSEYNIGYAATPIRKLPDLIRLMRMAERNLNKITCPLLIVQPSLDDTVRLDSPEIIYERATCCANKSILRLEKSRHVCTIEPEFDILYPAISTLFKEAQGEL